MKIKREYKFEHGEGKVASRRIEIEEGERIGIRVMNRDSEPVKDEEVISFFVPGVLTLTWKMGAKIED